MPPVPPRRRRARPVADAPIDSLLLTSDELAKGWLLTLLEQSPLEDAPRILATDLIREAPRICAAVLRAIVSDTDLRRLEPGGALRPLAARVGELAGATAPAAISRAVDALQAVTWSAVRGELHHPDADMVLDMSERLTFIAGLVRDAALEQHAPTVAVAPVSAVGGPGPVDPVAPVSAPADPRPVAPGSAVGAGERPPVWPDDARRPPPAADPRWVDALEDEIRHSAGSPLSLLLAELEDRDAIAAARPPAAAGETFSRFAGAVRSVVRDQDILVSESDARAWIIARDTARGGAYTLGERIAEAVGECDTWQGAALRASVGVAVLGEDGRTSAELIEAAEEARFAAAASGLRLLRADARREDGPARGG
jgi:GGDEF domain-containing protein